MSEITYAIYDGDIKEGGIYNVLASFERGILKGFKQAGLKVYNFDDCIEQKIEPDVVLGFNMAGHQHWEKNLNSAKLNIMWSVDSIFAQNFKVIKELSKYENYTQFGVAADDINGAKYYLPNLKYIYLPHATDIELWKKDEKIKKDIDIVFFASIRDYENELNQIKENNKKLYLILSEIIDILLKQPNFTFWQIYSQLQNFCNIKFNLKEYQYIYNFTTLYVEQIQKIKMIQTLSNLKVKIFGNDLWKKYLKGNLEYMGSADIMDCVKILNRTKISLHCHPVQLNGGLHERFLNAGAVEVFNLVSDTTNIKNIFSDNFGYFDHKTFDDIEQKALYYLNNNEERKEKAKAAYEIIKKDHTWKNRAMTINSFFKKFDNNNNL